MTTMVERSLRAEIAIDFAVMGVASHLACSLDHVGEGANGRTSVGDDAAPQGKEQSTRKGERILLVEDEALVAIEVAQMLGDAGFDVIGPAASVAHARSLLERQGCDAAVLDANLGRETAEPIAAELSVRGIPFVVTSGYARHQLPPALRSAPLISKPIRPDRLIGEIRRSLSR